MAKTKTCQANFSLPIELVEEFRRQIPKGEQSKVVAEAIRKELLRLRFARAIKDSFGAWKENAHPELADGTEAFIRRLRRSTRMNRQENNQDVA